MHFLLNEPTHDIFNASGFLSFCFADRYQIFHPKGDFPFRTDPLDFSRLKNYYQRFAYLILDKETRRIQLIRDHLGQQALYYCLHKGSCLFAETIQDIIQTLRYLPKMHLQEIKKLFHSDYRYSDETYYQGIYRVEPGHIVSIENQTLSKQAFWSLSLNEPELIYKQESEYHEHFSDLLEKGILAASQSKKPLALSFSGGMDSTAIYCTLKKHQIPVSLYMQDKAKPKKAAPARFEDKLIRALHIHSIQNVGLRGFQAIPSFQTCAQWFAGAAPHAHFSFSHPLHEAIQENGHDVLLCGFGGDQGVSSHLPSQFICPQLIHEKYYRTAWNICHHHHFSRRKSKLTTAVSLFLKYSHPHIHDAFLRFASTKIQIQNSFKPKKMAKPTVKHPFYTQYFQRLNLAEYDYLQGPLSHEIRMIIEYNSHIGNQLGFEYRYPMLWPPLLQFYLRVPWQQKWKNGKGRQLINTYLSQFLDVNLIKEYHKLNGIPLAAESIERFKEDYPQLEADYFQGLPLTEFIPYENHLKYQVNHVHCYMFKEYQKKCNRDFSE